MPRYLTARSMVDSGSRMTTDESPAGFTVLIEPTSACNLGCYYCYKGTDKHPVRMTVAMATGIIDSVLAENARRGAPTLFVWHGGEPTLAGARFFREVLAHSQAIKTQWPVRHTIQTNGTHLTDDLLEVFARSRVSIGVSLDGPRCHHDKVRPTLAGRPTYDRVVEGIDRARSRGIDVGILMSIGPGNVQYVGEMFEFCRARSLTFGLNPLTRDLHAVHDGLEIDAEAYLRACIQAFDLWFEQGESPIQVNPGYGIVRHILSRGRLSDCALSGNCQDFFLSVGPEGDVYPCNRFYGATDFRFGSLRTESLTTILESPVRAPLCARSAESIEACGRCDIRAFCNGGCMHHALAHYGRLDRPDHLCLVYRGLVRHAITRLSEICESERSPSHA